MYLKNLKPFLRELGHKVVLIFSMSLEKDPNIITPRSKINEYRKCLRNVARLMAFIDRLVPRFPKKHSRSFAWPSDMNATVFITGGHFCGMKYEVGYILLSPLSSVVPVSGRYFITSEQTSPTFKY